MSTNEKLEAALADAAMGLCVLPLHSAVNGSCSCGKADCASRGKHPRWDPELIPNGLVNATNDPTRITEWWALWPDANIGISMGASGLVGIDVDVHDGKPGMDSWQDLKIEYGADIENTAIVETPSGGLHVWYAAGPYRIGSKDGLLGEGVDLKAEGGYLVAPPSSIDGVEYAWAEGHELDRLVPIPVALGERLSFAKQKSPAEHAGPADDRIPQGQRHSTLVSLAGTMRNKGFSQKEIAAALHVAAAERCDPPYTDIDAIARDAARWPVGKTPTSAPPELAELVWTTGAELAAFTPEDPDYVLRPYLARGLTVQLAGKVKGGKTTLAMHMVAAVLHGHGFLEEP